ncbi:hypothetical protein LTR37_000993 [Vermiconidia calcicola]|uniref:Uncharacterized protein n=1 Tax=Vermiconidia calcicola TaxID=1690605 RepID=A0ACC3NWV5_9PEZI|nr:hypothetical protein LTR37_000993 [Vermiconidia calcicola]
MKKVAPSTSAAFRVLNTVELLESILGHLNCYEVLLLKRVSVHWKATVLGSSLLQTFLCSNHSKSAVPQPASYEDRLDYLDQPPTEEYPLAISNATSAHNFQNDSQPYILNPFLATASNKEYPGPEVLTYNLGSFKRINKHSACHRMYATRPPVKGIEVTEFFRSYTGYGAWIELPCIWTETWVSECQPEQGVMLSELLQQLEKLGREWEDAVEVRLKALV